MTTIGDRIRKSRLKQGLTQAELAELAGETRQRLYQLETRVTDPRASTLAKIARALRVSTDSLLGLRHARKAACREPRSD